ncbi:probable cytosolic oligopeptidase A [Ischnura elegans]|uniref:probable cytosolic oligopeptidase A n=1 Tax=Ischnura elegans TaxID=197161 RepID=UPI001ED88B6C|nr:probable cytosolic oligopeptidase A [Ischnura elegans]
MLLLCNMAATILRKRIPAIIKNNLHTSSAGSGYVVLIPETSADPVDQLPILKGEGLLDLSGLTTDQCIGAIQKLTLEYESGIWKIEENLGSGAGNFQDYVLPALENLGHPLDSTWSIAKVLYMCGGTPDIPTSVYENMHFAARSAKAKRFFSPRIHASVLEAHKALEKSEKSQVKMKDQELSRVIEKFVLEGRLNGLELTEEDKQLRFTKLRHELAGEIARFNSKLNRSTQLFSHTITDPNLVRDFPLDLLEEMALDRTQPSRGPWKVTLVGNVAARFMEHCPNAGLRWNVWQASVRRASAHGPNPGAGVSVLDTLRGKKSVAEEDLSNSTQIEKIRGLRKELANILGFENAAIMSMETKMARSVDCVRSMIASLLLKAKPAQEKELEDLHEFAKERGHPPSAPLDIWDIPYWRRKRIRSSLGGLEEDGLRAYFPLDKVLDGLFRLCGQLFSLQVEPLPLPMKGASAWHPDVKLYALNDLSSGETLGAFYLDPFVRPAFKVRSSEVPGWMLGMRNRTDSNIPLAALIFNFPMKSDKRPCLLSPREVHSLFHKFGHVLQHLLCRAKNSEVFGLNNVEWDAVDVCSNFMSLWLTDMKILKDVSGHHETGEPISDEIATILSTERQQLAGHDLCKELYLSDLDLELHSTDEFWLDIMRRLWPTYFPLPLDRQDSHVCSFRTAFETGSSGGNYFSKPWSLMVAADIHDAFTEELNSAPKDVSRTEASGKIGSRFRSTFLSLGGACHPGEIFRQFRGRDPSPNALLCSLGLKTKKQH